MNASTIIKSLLSIAAVAGYIGMCIPVRLERAWKSAFCVAGMSLLATGLTVIWA